MMMMNGRSNGRFPFTASQWQELEHQALIFKYMASGHPIPSDLILPIRRSLFLDSTSTQTSFYPNQPNALGWGCFQMGFGRKAEDPEPGRCRRTDGKKWRCSKEAHPDSKYCERHMHRGKNRSRKPVEMSLNNTSAGNNNNNNNNSTNSSTTTAITNPPSSSTSTITTSGYPSSLYTTNHHYHSMLASDTQQHHHNTPLYPPFSSYHKPNNMPQNHPSPHLHLDHSGSSSADRDYRYLQGVKDEIDQYSFFPETNGGGRDAPWRFTPLGLGEPKPKVCSFTQQEVGCYSNQVGPNLDKEGASGGVVEDKQQQHCFVLGADFKMERPTSKEERSSGDDESQRTLRHFFDEWPPLKSKESWMGLDEEDANRSNWSSSFNKTQLSISTPMAHNDLSLQW